MQAQQNVLPPAQPQANPLIVAIEGINIGPRAGVQKMIADNIDEHLASVHTWLGDGTSLETAIALAIFHAGARVAIAGGVYPYAANIDSVIHGVNVMNADDVRALRDAAQRAFCQMVSQAMHSATDYLVDLMMCEQVRTLKESNVKGYFMERGGTEVEGGKILKVLSVYRMMFPKFVTFQNIRDRIQGSRFVGYHTNFCSTPALVRKYRDECPNDWAASTTPEMRQALTNALAAPWDMGMAGNLSPHLIVMTGAYLKACKQLPDGWKQFEKAKAASQGGAYATMVAYFTQRIEIQGDVTAIDGARTIAALEAARPAVMNANAVQVARP